MRRGYAAASVQRQQLSAMSENSPWLATQLAIIASGVVFGVGWRASSGPAGYGAWINVIEALAVIWATKYAADNLRQLREAEAEKLKPKLLVALRAVWNGDGPMFAVEVHNYGSSMAVGIRAETRSCSQYEEHAVKWTPLALSQSYVRPIDHVEADLKLSLVGLVLVHYVDIRVTFSGATDIDMQTVWRFAGNGQSLASVGTMIGTARGVVA